MKTDERDCEACGGMSGCTDCGYIDVEPNDWEYQDKIDSFMYKML